MNNIIYTPWAALEVYGRNCQISINNGREMFVQMTYQMTQKHDTKFGYCMQSTVQYAIQDTLKDRKELFDFELF